MVRLWCTVWLLLTSCVFAQLEYPLALKLPKEIKLISTEALQRLIQSEPQLNLIDVRDDAERKRHGWLANSKIAQFVNATFAEELQRAVIHPQAPVVLYCTLGGRSKRGALHLLKLEKYPVIYVLDGGLNAWKRAGGEIQTF